MTPLNCTPVSETLRWTGVALVKEVARQKRRTPSSRATKGALSVRRSAARDVRLVHLCSLLRALATGDVYLCWGCISLREDRHCFAGALERLTRAYKGVVR